MINRNIKLGKLLVSSGKISKKQLKAAIEKQKYNNKKIEDVLIENNYVTEEDILEILKFQLGVPYVDLEKHQIDSQIVKIIPESLAKKYNLIAIAKKNNFLIVAMVDPLNIFAIDDIKLVTGYNIQPVIALKRHIIGAINKYYEKEIAKKVLKEFEESYTPISFNGFDEEELINVDGAPVVKLVNSIIRQAVKMKASDIHIEPFSQEVRVRFRIDGDLQKIMSLPKDSLSSIVTRIKIISNIDIAEKRIPQDGRVENVFEGREIDMRISTLPTVYGEKVVMRLLDRNSFIFSKEQLGFSDKNLSIIDRLLKQPHGIILVTGPTATVIKLG